jgi:hypothetical protein
MNDPQIFLCGLIVGTILGMGWGYAAGIMSKLKGERDDE